MFYAPVMVPDLGGLFRALLLLTLLAVPLYAWRVRGRAYALFGLVTLLFSFPGAWISHARLAAWIGSEARPWLDASFAYGVSAAGLHLIHLVQARLRSRIYRATVSIPGQVFLAAGFLAGLWQLLLLPLSAGLTLVGLGAVAQSLHWLDWFPFALAGLSIITSLRRATEWVRIRLDVDGPKGFERVPVERSRRPHPISHRERPLRIVQIADPHLGPWQSIARLRHTLESLLSHDPDLVLLTGDFLTMEGQGSRGALAEALAPLRPFRGRCFAVFGNHDLEAEREVRDALAASGVALLVDAATVATTPVGPVQILGAHYRRRDRISPMRALLSQNPRQRGIPRLLLLHDPSGFRDVPDGEVDLTLSGHTHGGQLGLVSFGLDWTVLRNTRWPDHGLFARGSNRLYVHRGTGFYGFPLRVGVPGETSILELVMDPSA